MPARVPTTLRPRSALAPGKSPAASAAVCTANASRITGAVAISSRAVASWSAPYPGSIHGISAMPARQARHPAIATRASAAPRKRPRSNGLVLTLYISDAVSPNVVR